MGAEPYEQLDSWERSNIADTVAGFPTDEACLMHYRSMDDGLGEQYLEPYVIVVVGLSMLTSALGGALLGIPVLLIAVAIAVPQYRYQKRERHRRYLKWRYTAHQIHTRFPDMVDEHGDVNPEYEFVGRDTHAHAA